MYQLDFIVNGGYVVPLGIFSDKEQVKRAIAYHIWSYSAVNKPKIVISGTEDCRRVDYGARDCYYLMTRKGSEVSGLDSDSLQSD